MLPWNWWWQQQIDGLNDDQLNRDGSDNTQKEATMESKRHYWDFIVEAQK